MQLAFAHFALLPLALSDGSIERLTIRLMSDLVNPTARHNEVADRWLILENLAHLDLGTHEAPLSRLRSWKLRRRYRGFRDRVASSTKTNELEPASITAL